MTALSPGQKKNIRVYPCGYPRISALKRQEKHERRERREKRDGREKRERQEKHERRERRDGRERREALIMEVSHCVISTECFRDPAA